MSDASDDDAKWRATFDEDELVTLPPPRPARAQARRMELRLPDRLRRFVEHEAARLCEPASVIVRRALTSTPEWKAWDAQQSPTVAPSRRDGRLAPEGVETARAKDAREKLERETAEKLAVAARYRDERGATHQHGNDVYDTWEYTLEIMQRRNRGPRHPNNIPVDPARFDRELAEIVQRRERYYREAGVEPPPLPAGLTRTRST